MDSKARITISRRSPVDLGYRQIFVSLDGNDFAMLKNGGEATREVEAGPHRMRVHNTLFWKNLEVELAAGEHARFVVANTAGFATNMLMGILGAGPIYLSVERVDGT